MNLVCPIDNKDDSIQKVSAVVTSGQSVGTFSGPTGGTVSYDGKSGSVSGYTSLSGSSTSSLAKLLYPPQAPIEPSGFGLLWILIIFPVIPMIGVIIGLIVGGITYIPMSLLVSLTGLNFDEATIFTPFYGIGAIVGGLLAFLSFRKKDNKKKATSRIRYSTEKPQWDKAIQKWNRLYYCHKHDIVFDPENGESCPPSSLKEFLY